MTIFQWNMSLSHEGKFEGVSIDLKLNNLDLSENTTEFKTLPTRPRFKTFLVGIFARGTLLRAAG